MAKKRDNTPVTVVKNPDDKQRDQLVANALESVRKMHGEDSVFTMSEHRHVDIPVINTGSLGLDIATGVGGVPRGRIVEIFGPESSGKTTLCLSIAAQAHQLGLYVAYIDSEHAIDMSWARSLGVDPSKLIISQPESGEKALQIAKTLIESSGIAIVIIDSVAALTPEAEISGMIGDSHVGLQARLMSQGLRMLNGIISTTNTLVIFTNQLREKVGILYGSPETTPGGRALKFYASQRIDLRKQESIKSTDGRVIGARVRAKIIKNKVAPPFTETEFDIMFNEGISRSGEIIDIAESLGLVEKRGAFYRYEGNLIGQGRENAKTYIRENPDFALHLENLIRERYGITLIDKAPIIFNADAAIQPIALHSASDDDGQDFVDE